MSYKYGRVSYSTTGSKTIATTFQPVEVELVLTNSVDTSGTEVRRSEGVTDGTNYHADAFSVYASNRFQERFTDRLASVWEWNGSAWTEVVKITFTSWSATGVTLNVVTTNVNYQIAYKIRG